MLNRREAISFVDNVKLQFEDDPEKYDRFLDIMRDLKGNVCVIFSFSVPPLPSCD
jgi:paired amphipathic helix protein Sin3a